MAKNIYAFLESLSANNSKEWMDANRQWYVETKEELITLFSPILSELKEFDPRIVQPSVRKSISRINNNLMFHPERPTYKDHFGVVFGYGKGLADFYVGLGVRESEIAGGLWHPDSEKLKKVRMEIDYEGDRLREILNRPAFKDQFEIFNRDALKTAPKGYPIDHEHIDLLRLKSIAALRPLKKKEVFSEGFTEVVMNAFKAIVPLIDFVNTAITDD